MKTSMLLLSLPCLCLANLLCNKQIFNHKVQKLNAYFSRENLIARGKFDQVPPPAVLVIDNGVTLYKPGRRVTPDKMQNEPKIWWNCGCEENKCDSGLYTYVVEDNDVPSLRPNETNSFIHYLRYNAPCNQVELGDIGMVYKTQFAMDFTPISFEPLWFQINDPPRDPNFKHAYVHQVYCQKRRLSPSDFGDSLQTSDCTPNLMQARSVNHQFLVQKLGLIESPVAASAIDATYTPLANRILCEEYNSCPGGNAGISPAPGYECQK